MFKKLLFSLLFFVSLRAESESPMLDFFNSADWDLFFDKFVVTAGICTCDNYTGDIPFGLKATLVEPIIGFSSSNTPMHLVGLDQELESDVLDRQGQSRQGSKKDGNSQSFRQANMISFPLLAILGTAMPDVMCFEKNTEALGTWLSDVDPTYQNDILSNASSNPITGRHLFNNPIADIACLADCIGATADDPINTLYWCNGCRGSAGSTSSGYNKLGDPMENSEMIAFRRLHTLHETSIALKTSNATFAFVSGLRDSMCVSRYFPYIIKTQYYFQPAYGEAKRLGAWRSHFEFMSSPEKKDAFFFWIWRVRDFCLGQAQCNKKSN